MKIANNGDGIKEAEKIIISRTDIFKEGSYDNYLKPKSFILQDEFTVNIPQEVMDKVAESSKDSQGFLKIAVGKPYALVSVCPTGSSVGIAPPEKRSDGYDRLPAHIIPANPILPFMRNELAQQIQQIQQIQNTG